MQYKNDEIIVAQCCFKGAIDLAVANKITVDEINEWTTTFTEAIIKKYGNKVSVTQSQAKPVFKPKDNYNKTTNNATVRNPEATVSEKQLWLLNKLVGELPVDRQSGFTGLIKSNMKMGLASSLIGEMQEIIDNQKPVPKPLNEIEVDADGTPTEAPF